MNSIEKIEKEATEKMKTYNEDSNSYKKMVETIFSENEIQAIQADLSSKIYGKFELKVKPSGIYVEIEIKTIYKQFVTIISVVEVFNKYHYILVSLESSSKLYMTFVNTEMLLRKSQQAIVLESKLTNIFKGEINFLVEDSDNRDIGDFKITITPNGRAIYRDQINRAMGLVNTWGYKHLGAETYSETYSEANGLRISFYIRNKNGEKNETGH